MTLNTKYRSESSMPMMTYRSIIGRSEKSPDSLTATERRSCKVFNIDYSKPLPSPKKGRALSSFIESWESDPVKHSDLREARTSIGEELASGAGETIKSLRLKKGLSQSGLASLMATKQPHIARIEKGRDSVTFETLCKLSEQLEVDFNTLVGAIKRQAAAQNEPQS